MHILARESPGVRSIANGFILLILIRLQSIEPRGFHAAKICIYFLRLVLTQG